MGPYIYKGTTQCAWLQTRLGPWFLLPRPLHSLDGTLPVRRSQPLQSLADLADLADLAGTFVWDIRRRLLRVSFWREGAKSCFLLWRVTGGDGISR